jgi:hypothetical protein
MDWLLLNRKTTDGFRDADSLQRVQLDGHLAPMAECHACVRASRSRSPARRFSRRRRDHFRLGLVAEARHSICAGRSLVDEITKPSENGKSKPPPLTDPTTVDNERGALIVKEFTAPATLATLVGKNLKGAVAPPAFKLYRDQLLRDSGQPTDAIEVMLIEQLMWAHHRIGDLHVQASTASSPETFEIYSAAGVRLMAEFRKTSLALREYRSPITPKNVTLVRQQNLAAGNQEIALLDNRPNNVGPHPTESEPTLLETQKALTHEKATLFNAYDSGSKIAQFEETVSRSPGE